MCRIVSIITLLLSFTTLALSAPLFQDRVERLRAEGLSERDILSHLQNRHPTPAYTGVLENEYYEPSSNRDTEGDVSPGASPASPQQLHIGGTTFVDRMSDLVDATLKRDGDERLIAARAAEGKHPVWRFRWMGAERR